MGNDWGGVLLGHFKSKSAFTKVLSQTALPLIQVQPSLVPDRNRSKGGRSFYFFDFDDNIAFLDTPTRIYHRISGHQIQLNSKEYALYRTSIGRFGKFENYEIRLGDGGSFQDFRDLNLGISKYFGQRQSFVRDIRAATKGFDYKWKGPSWNSFYWAVSNRRPISLITARGHSAQTIKEGLEVFVKAGHLPVSPNFLTVYPVNCPKAQCLLTGRQFNEGLEVARLKQLALRKSVEKAFEEYGESPYHRFGVSDDDPKNVSLMLEELLRLKADYPQNAFYLINTLSNEEVKTEIFLDHLEMSAQQVSI